MSTQKLRTPKAAILLLFHTILNIVSIIVMSDMGVTPQPLATLAIPINIFLCIVLFKKDRANILVFAVATYAIKSLVGLVMAFDLSTLFHLFSYALVLLLTLAYSDQTLIKIDLCKIKEHSKILNKLVLICFLLAPFMRINLLNDIGLLFSAGIGELLFSLLHIFAFTSLVNWLMNPPYQTVDSEYGDAYCSMTKHILLCLFSCGIWPLVWIYRVTKCLNKAPGCESYDPLSKLLLCIFIPFYSIYWFYKHGQRIDSIAQNKNLNSNMATLCLVLAIFIPFVAMIIMQDKINQICKTNKEE